MSDDELEAIMAAAVRDGDGTTYAVETVNSFEQRQCRMRRLRRVWAASLLLIVGIAFVTWTAQTGWWGWSLLGNLCLVFVAPLIVDATR